MSIARRYRPNFSHWANFDSLKISDIAPLMFGVEPRALEDFTVQDPNNPTSTNGVAPDFSDFEEMIMSGVAAGTLQSCGASVSPVSRNTQVVTATLIPWLRSKDFHELADGLTSTVGLPDQRGDEVKREVMFERHSKNWLGMNSDFHHAKKNGLADAAQGSKFGYWYEDAALSWAARNSKLRSDTAVGNVKKSSYFPT